MSFLNRFKVELQALQWGKLLRLQVFHDMCSESLHLNRKMLNFEETNKQTKT